MVIRISEPSTVTITSDCTGRWHTSLLGVLLFSGVAELIVLGRVNGYFFPSKTVHPQKHRGTSQFQITANLNHEWKTTYMKLHDPLKHLNDSRPIFLILKLTGLTDQGQNSTGFTSYELQGEALPNTSGNSHCGKSPVNFPASRLKIWSPKISEHIICKEFQYNYITTIQKINNAPWTRRTYQKISNNNGLLKRSAAHTWL